MQNLDFFDLFDAPPAAQSSMDTAPAVSEPGRTRVAAPPEQAHLAMLELLREEGGQSVFHVATNYNRRTGCSLNAAQVWDILAEMERQDLVWSDLNGNERIYRLAIE